MYHGKLEIQAQVTRPNTWIENYHHNISKKAEQELDMAMIADQGKDRTNKKYSKGQRENRNLLFIESCKKPRPVSTEGTRN